MLNGPNPHRHREPSSLAPPNTVDLHSSGDGAADQVRYGVGIAIMRLSGTEHGSQTEPDQKARPGVRSECHGKRTGQAPEPYRKRVRPPHCRGAGAQSHRRGNGQSRRDWRSPFTRPSADLLTSRCPNTAHTRLDADPDDTPSVALPPRASLLCRRFVTRVSDDFVRCRRWYPPWSPIRLRQPPWQRTNWSRSRFNELTKQATSPRLQE